MSFVSNKSVIRSLEDFEGWELLKLDKTSAGVQEVCKAMEGLLAQHMEIDGDKIDDDNDGMWYGIMAISFFQ